MDFVKLVPKTFSPKLMEMDGISAKTIEAHLKLYQGYVAKYNEVQEKLAQLTDEDLSKANQVYSVLRSLKVDLSFAWGGVINHEIYFGHLGGKGGVPTGDLLKQIEKDFGSFEKYKKDVAATGIAARGWVWTAWNTAEKRLFNYLGDAQNTFPVWGAVPVLALDTYEHAYFIDYGVNRAQYIESFFKNLDWSVVETAFHSVVSCSCDCSCEKQGEKCNC